MTTVLEVIDGGTTYLEKRGVAEARLNMQRLVGHFLGFSRVQLYLEFDRPLSEEELAPIREALKKRGQGIPLQHLQGEVEFMGRDFLCDGRGLIPRPETEELVSLVLKETIPPSPRILDLGTGSGVIGLSLAAELPQHEEVVLSDVSPEALALAEENAARLEQSVTLTESHLFDAIEGKFDLIVTNLPYVPETSRESLAPELQHDPDLALFSGPDGLDLVRKFAGEVASYLKPNGLLAMEVGFDQGAATVELLEKGGLQSVTVKADLSQVLRFPFART